MDRCAIFIDAGYLYAEGGKLCGLGPSRSNVKIIGAAASEFFAALATELCGLQLLRIYWYDGARDGVPTSDQQKIAGLPSVKLRLGRINIQNQQKGVDALIYRDLTTLARERAISDAFILAGDEDIREGVKAAQDIGVRVTLVGIATSTGGGNQSRELRNEADKVVQLNAQQLSSFVRGREILRQPSGGIEDVAAAVGNAAAQYARTWEAGATREEIDSLLENYPRIPGHIDPELLAFVEGKINDSLRQSDQLRKAARHEFWTLIRSLAADRERQIPATARGQSS